MKVSHSPDFAATGIPARIDPASPRAGETAADAAGSAALAAAVAEDMRAACIWTPDAVALAIDAARRH
ncbi:MAG: hypothetical protein FJX35_18440 [Alphaproteobacteria bacterium]|nr:hypothetical protein [Alphaproteobacteria bacterium]